MRRMSMTAGCKVGRGSGCEGEGWLGTSENLQGGLQIWKSIATMNRNNCLLWFIFQEQSDSWSL